jgi:hypothetical protein
MFFFFVLSFFVIFWFKPHFNILFKWCVLFLFFSDRCPQLFGTFVCFMLEICLRLSWWMFSNFFLFVSFQPNFSFSRRKKTLKPCSWLFAIKLPNICFLLWLLYWLLSSKKQPKIYKYKKESPQWWSSQINAFWMKANWASKVNNNNKISRRRGNEATNNQ